MPLRVRTARPSRLRARRVIRRRMVIAATAVVVVEHNHYVNINGEQHQIYSLDGKQVIEDPHDPNGYIELVIQ